MPRFEIYPKHLRTLDGILVDGVLREVGWKEEVDGVFNVRLTDGETVVLPADQPVTLCGNYEVQPHELFGGSQEAVATGASSTDSETS